MGALASMMCSITAFRARTSMPRFVATETVSSREAPILSLNKRLSYKNVAPRGGYSYASPLLCGSLMH
ncbi:Uncharacterised protein [Mycobacteroides abscessus subsp. abscessus]|nr:Uncharacterised protein [Mycobacteroides abscessus subsp. abscessus]